ncbi:carbonic anhydrase [Pacificitalea manganoxidans]|uniref:carbonic anhydrase n=1 Tax=Pacificitalea manganoxidans TaxID=1411902 RepID=A0A291M2G1_9RHOB|nr:carbonic anhydrase [Pacificitalea manganoxidans]MAQ45853.1 carbonic anhydrase [Actibacterium sp.]OWU70249.1 carbonic anhydrase [Roseovarius sp. 22II1-1F6A]ATI43193.1 carbonic anhydrase [Pacificitalea manganoxidans]MBF53798.1 carbonic anhydrase [Actibacterium sp.]MBF54134.1 carbonic anhydrase [Actibacterium sp.]|tara:strand:- start:553 stop:1203 length:651 start_codon:yes stop_codon:yes gene_type:complete
MTIAKPLPSYLVNRYHGWRATTYAENKSWHRRLAEDGQRPRFMVIACCDSRVDIPAVLGATTGDIFLHRNIANLIPPFEPDGEKHGTSAAIEYAVNFLKVAHIIIVAHSDCGGVKGCHDMCAGDAPEFEQKTSFIGRWLDILRPGYERVSTVEDRGARLTALEQQSVIVSLENLAKFPFVEKAMAEETLTLHGMWFDIGEGRLESYDSEMDSFYPV